MRLLIAAGYLPVALQRTGNLTQTLDILDVFDSNDTLPTAGGQPILPVQRLAIAQVRTTFLLLNMTSFPKFVKQFLENQISMTALPATKKSPSRWLLVFKYIRLK